MKYPFAEPGRLLIVPLEAAVGGPDAVRILFGQSKWPHVAIDPFDPDD